MEESKVIEEVKKFTNIWDIRCKGMGEHVKERVAAAVMEQVWRIEKRRFGND